jgi:hypothetical protein
MKLPENWRQIYKTFIKILNIRNSKKERRKFKRSLKDLK